MLKSTKKSDMENTNEGTPACICVKCMTTRHGQYNLDCLSDIIEAIRYEDHDKEVFINPAYIESVTFQSVETAAACYDSFIKTSSTTKNIFFINMHHSISYAVRECYWDKFHEEWTQK